MARSESTLIDMISSLTLPSLAGGRVSMRTLLSSPGLVLHLDKPSEKVAIHWAQLAPRVGSLGYRVALAFAGRRAWRLGSVMKRMPITILVDEDLKLARILGGVRRLPLIGLGVRVEPVTVVVARVAGELRVEVARGSGDGFSHTLWALEAAVRLARSREV